MIKKNIVHAVLRVSVLALTAHFLTSCLPSGEHGQTSPYTSQNSEQSPEFMLTLMSPTPYDSTGKVMNVSGFCLPKAWIKFEGSALAKVKYTSCTTDGTFSYHLETVAQDGIKELIVSSSYNGEKERVRIEREIEIDLRAPLLTLVTPQASSILAQNQMVTGQCESPFDVEVSGLGLAAPLVFQCLNNSFSGRLVFNNSQSTAQLEFLQKDRAGNKGVFRQSWPLALASTSNLVIAQPLNQQYFSNQLQLSGVCDGQLPVQIAIAKAQYQSQTPCTQGQYSINVGSAFGADGNYSIVVSQLNTGSDAQAVSVIRDTMKPNLSFISPQTNSQYSQNLLVSGVCESGTQVNISGDFIPGANKVTCTNSQFSANFSLLNLSGSHTLNISQTDFAGNFNSISTSFQVMSTGSSNGADGLALYTNNCAGCHGALANSNKKGRSAADIKVGIMYVGGMKSLSVLSNLQLEAIAMVLNPQTSPTPDPTNPDPKDPTMPTNSPYMCVAGQQGFDRTRKLTVREYQKSLLDLFSGQFTLSDLSREVGKIPDDRKRHGFDTEDTTVSGLAIEGYFDVAGKIGDLIRANTSRLSSMGLTCGQSNAVSDSCALDFIKSFGLRALRRPLFGDEATRYFELYRGLKSSVSDKVALSYTIEAFIQSPEFLYHVENQGLAASAGKYQLTPYEMASRISYLITGTMPDQILLDSAKNNQLGTAVQRSAQINRLMASAGAKEQIKNYYEQWFGLNRLKQIPSLPPGISGISAAELSSQAKREIYSFMDGLIWTDNKGFASVLTDSTAQIESAQMAALYGIEYTPNRGLASGSQFSKNIEAESFSMRTSVGSIDGSGFSIWSENESIAERVDLPTGDLQMNVRARRQANGTVPDQAVTMDIYIDSKAVATFQVRPDTVMDYKFNYSSQQGSHLLQIVFRGDYYSANPAGDLNLWIDSVQVQSSGGGATAMSVSLASAGRSGLLTRAAFLVSGETHSNPIVRGVEILKDVQCVDLSPPDASDPALKEAFTPVPFDAMKTNRERITMKTSPQQCQVCHRQINPIGFAFENYGAFGEFQTTEVNFDMNTNRNIELPVDSETTASLDGQNQRVMNAVDLSTLLSKSTSVKMCAAEKLFTFAHGRKPAAEDACSLETIYSKVIDSNLSFKDYYRSVIEDPNFSLKRAQ